MIVILDSFETTRFIDELPIVPKMEIRGKRDPVF